jgi:hypothetical protein
MLMRHLTILMIVMGSCNLFAKEAWIKRLHQEAKKPEPKANQRKGELMMIHYKDLSKTTKDLTTSFKRGLRFLLFGKEKRKSLQEKHSVVLF